MNINCDPDKTEIHLTNIESKQLYVLLLEEINASYDFWRNIGENEKYEK